MQRLRGTPYRSGYAFDRPVQTYRGEDTGPMPEVTGGLSLTQELLRWQPAPVRTRWSNALLGLAIIGAITVVAICAGIGLWLASSMYCPCTFGGTP